MFPARTPGAFTAASPVQPNVATVPEIKTSTSVVKSLASGLLAASPGQASVGSYVNFQFGMGKKPSAVQSHWLGLRKIARQMEVIESKSIQIGRGLSDRDRKLAARRGWEYLQALLKNVSAEEKNHPSFRKELLEHLENIVRWYPRSPHVWALAYTNLQPGESVCYKSQMLDKNVCRVMMYQMHIEEVKEKISIAANLLSRSQGNRK